MGLGHHWWAGLTLAACCSCAAVIAISACEEHVPAELEKPPPVLPPPVPIGLDARPVSATCKATPKPVSSNTLIGYELVSKAPFYAPVEINVHDGKVYVLELDGKVHRLNDDGLTSSIVIDFTAKIVAGGEAGLLGIAFHPQFATNGFVYFYYTVAHPTQPPPAGTVFQSALVRYKSNDGGLTVDPASEKRIMTVDQPFSNHNGGTIAFGKDGFLYWGLGDGGGGGDTLGNAQKKTTVLGKMVRIDVDGGDPYAIPPTNPFADGVNGSREIFALGLRNPYRWRFDSVTGDLWAGDVGQGAREEISKIVLGGNYGWNIKEGKACYSNPMCESVAGLIDPVVDHDRDGATVITGGVVYRGAGVPLLTGKYVYGDFGTGQFYAIPIDAPAPTPMRLDEGIKPSKHPSAFAIDANGEIVFVDYFSGEVLRVVAGGGGPSAPAPLPEMPAKLSATGCVEANDPKTPVAGLFKYDVNIAQWMDGATAERWLSIPADGVLRTGPEGRLGLPPGSVAMKTLSAEGRRLETQLLLQRPDATWSAYTYVWSPDQTDATLTSVGASVTLPSGRNHIVVSTQQCLSCHTPDVVPTIGLEAAQLDRDDVDYGGPPGGTRKGNPLATLAALKMLDTELVPRDSYEPLPRDVGFHTAEKRARGYLHANCAHCHRGNSGNADGQPPSIDLRYATTALKDTHLCNVPGASKAGGRVRLAPSDPNESQLLRAMQTTGEGRMPPIGTLLVDPVGTQLVSTWISAITKCE